ncbi:hypothetical protein [Jiulongibacter sediminis]|uniref:ABC transporter permease n=1 Tax=Jiulongibacter sediminis TaxID=1605367 RepID=A0A0P7BYN5_9BACT|nr:hypothetical protein [Jiulongibacter sediminis]KPM49615.1 hypothetical protein AFM12_03195 [Jiulongibacter sediminis]TBX26653.1 hypothetical protein TK44_03200 [Jiulongibacter sediminis]
MLQRTLVREYYRQNVAFYLFLLLFCFGFMSGQEHRQLITVIMARPALLIFVGLAWFFHVLKSALFVHQTLQEQEYAFLQDNSILPFKHKWTSLLALQLNLNLPFALYAAAMMTLGLMNQNYISVALVISVNLVLLFAPVIWLNRRFLNFNKEIGITKYFKFQFIPKHRIFYFVRFLLNEKWVLYVSMKIYSVFFIVAAARLFPTDEYDFRLLGLGVFLGSVGLFPLGVEKINFESQKLGFERNLPFDQASKFTSIVLEAFVLIIPEIILIAYNWFDKVSLFQLAGAILYLLAALTFWYCIQYSSFASRKDFNSKMFFVAVFQFLLVMFKVPLLLSAIIILTLSGFIVRRNYYNFELLQSDDK